MCCISTQKTHKCMMKAFELYPYLKYIFGSQQHKSKIQCVYSIYVHSVSELSSICLSDIDLKIGI